jgi:hypothetical protein
MKRLSLLARIWLGGMFVATVLAVAWFFYISALAGVAVYDFNPEALQRLGESQAKDIVRTAKLLMFASASPALILCVGWAVTAVVWLRRRSTVD